MQITILDRENLFEVAEFRKTFAHYFIEIFENDPANAPTIEDLPKICDYFLNETKYEDSWIFIARDDGVLAGFIIAHIDRFHKDWCQRDGWGLIREIYVAPEYRKKGIGVELVAKAEAEMAHFKPLGYYLTCDSGTPFWEKVGYANTGEIEEINDSYIYVKEAK
ncbi:MAG: GNAT family N-acetyltransferase [Defluviitaleaceae bacterium]|nr:GNAT family N-acetyltransferase [Defluviitaleaceae bacterium]